MSIKPIGYQEWYVQSAANEHKRHVMANPSHIEGLKHRLREMEQLEDQAPKRCIISTEQRLHLSKLIAEIEAEMVGGYNAGQNA